MLKKILLTFLIFLGITFIWDRVFKTFFQDKEFAFENKIIEAISANSSYSRIGELLSFNLRFDSPTSPGSDSVRFTIAVQGRDSAATFTGLAVKELENWRIAELERK